MNRFLVTASLMMLAASGSAQDLQEIVSGAGHAAISLTRARAPEIRLRPPGHDPRFRCGQGRPRVVSATPALPETLSAEGSLAGRGFLSPPWPRLASGGCGSA